MRHLRDIWVILLRKVAEVCSLEMGQLWDKWDKWDKWDIASKQSRRKSDGINSSFS